MSIFSEIKQMLEEQKTYGGKDRLRSKAAQVGGKAIGDLTAKVKNPVRSMWPVRRMKGALGELQKRLAVLRMMLRPSPPPILRKRRKLIALRTGSDEGQRLTLVIWL